MDQPIQLKALIEANQNESQNSSLGAHDNGPIVDGVIEDSHLLELANIQSQQVDPQLARQA